MTVLITTLLVLLFVAYTTFAYRYARYSRWKATWQGIVLESQKITLASLVAFFVVDTILEGAWPGRNPILIVILIALTIEAWATLGGLLATQRRKKARENELQ